MHVVLIKYIYNVMYICMHACRNFVDILKLYRDDVGDVNDVNSATGAGASVMVVC